MSRLRPVLATLLVLLVVPVLAAIGAPGQASAGAGSRVTAAAAPTTTVTGRVVRFNNGKPVAGVRVLVHDVGAPDDDNVLLGSDLTDRDGRYVVTFRGDHEEFGIRVAGRRVGFQNGWLGFRRLLYPSFAEATSWGITPGAARIKVS